MVSATKHKVKMFRLILSDLDHTLLRQDGVVSMRIDLSSMN